MVLARQRDRLHSECVFSNDTRGRLYRYDILGQLCPRHNKPLLIGEFCDEFNDGYDTQQMINFLIQNNGVYLGMWDSDTGTIGNPPGLGNCHITDTVHNGGQTGVPPSPVTLTKMNQLFGGTNYTGRFFQPYLPPPVPNPLGF